MNRTRRASFFVPLFVCSSLIAGPASAARHARSVNLPTTSEIASNSAAPEAPASTIQPGAKVVQYGEKDVLTLKVKLRFSTLIVLPKNEEILEVTCGDKDLFVVNATQNLAHVKPAKAGSQTNLNLITASGNIYSFVLMEVSAIPHAEPDLKLFVELKDELMLSAASAPPRFVSAREIEDYQQQVEMAKEETHQVKKEAQAAIESCVSKFLANMRFPYRFEAGKKPFRVRAIYNDDKFTYIQARPEETPALYEIKDGKSNLINFEYRNGVYVVDKILDRGYLAIGKQKLGFAREE